VFFFVHPVLFMVVGSVIKNKHRAVGQGARRFGKRRISADGGAFKKAAQRRITA
jgi:hypothetical protein